MIYAFHGKSSVVAVSLLLLLLLAGCGPDESKKISIEFEPRGREVPEFSADSAYHFIEQQVAAGPRNPGSEGHRKTKTYLKNKLSEYAGNSMVYLQRFEQPGYGKDTLQLANIIAAFNPQATDRIMVCAHWDTRPRAEEADTNKNRPIIGADDGGSGVGVLLELARIFRQHQPPIGVDIILFDGEDYGKSGSNEMYFLGSRYWSKNPPVPGYNPRFGILLDMVGGEGAEFPREQHSMTYAPSLVREVWTIADQLGYSKYFIDGEGARISDDHLVINRVTGIPTIDIIRHEPTEGPRIKFAPYWHTHNDTMDIISKETLQAVGDVLCELIYNRI